MKLAIFLFENPTIFVLKKDGSITDVLSANAPLTLVDNWTTSNQVYLDWIADRLSKETKRNAEHLYVVLPQFVYAKLTEHQDLTNQLSGLFKQCSISYHSLIEAVIGHLSATEHGSEPVLFGHTAFGHTAFYEFTKVGHNYEYQNRSVRSNKAIDVLKGVVRENGENIALPALLSAIDVAYQQIKKMSHDAIDLDIDAGLDIDLDWPSEITFRQFIDYFSKWGQAMFSAGEESRLKVLWLSSLFNYDVVRTSILASLEQTEFLTTQASNSLEESSPGAIVSQLQVGLQRIIENPTLITNNSEFPTTVALKASFQKGPVILLSASDDSEPLASVPMPIPPLEINWGDDFHMRIENWFPKPTADFTNQGKSYKLLGFNFKRSLCGDVSLIAETSDQDQTTVTIKNGCELRYE